MGTWGEGELVRVNAVNQEARRFVKTVQCSGQVTRKRVVNCTRKGNWRCIPNLVVGAAGRGGLALVVRLGS
jgi:hypothetical protein